MRNMKFLTYVGSQTDAEHPTGIYILESDADTGAIRLLRAIEDGVNPTYMAVTRDGSRLYSVTGRPGFGGKGHNGGLAAYRTDGDNLIPINCVPTHHTVPCHIALSPDEKTLVWAEYSHATAGCAELSADGAISAHRQMVQHAGDGPNKPRQDKAHAHCAIVTPDSRYLLVADLGIDQIKAYDFAHRADGLKEGLDVTIHTTPPGAGPRHLIFSADGRFAYLVNELASTVQSFAFDGARFTALQTLSMLPRGFKGETKAAAIRLSPDGRWLLASNRGHDSIAAFPVGDDGRLGETPVISFLTGHFPRDFAFVPGRRARTPVSALKR